MIETKVAKGTEEVKVEKKKLSRRESYKSVLTPTDSPRSPMETFQISVYVPYNFK